MKELKRIRNGLGWSQQRLANESGVNKATINQVEQGKRSPSIPTLESLARAMGAEVGDFFPKVQAPLFEDLVEKSRAIEEEKRERMHEFFERAKALDDDELRRLGDSLLESQYGSEENATRYFVVGLMLQVRAGKASEGARKKLEALAHVG